VTLSGLVRQLLSSSRVFIVVAVVGSFVASACALVYGGLATFVIVIGTFRSLDFSTSGAKVLSVDLVTMIDLFLIGTVLYIVAVGLYELFIDPGLPMPRWLKITTLDDLKERLLGVVAVLLAVTFLGNAVTWNGSTDILALGVAVGVVLGVVSLTIAVMNRTHPAQENGDNGREPQP
jgi:uncharacterized membrane protein YqhA